MCRDSTRAAAAAAGGNVNGLFQGRHSRLRRRRPGQFGNLGGQFGLQGNNQDNGVYLVSMISQLVDQAAAPSPSTTR
jgi:hypothetical protein